MAKSHTYHMFPFEDLDHPITFWIRYLQTLSIFSSYDRRVLSSRRHSAYRESLVLLLPPKLLSLLPEGRFFRGGGGGQTSRNY